MSAATIEAPPAVNEAPTIWTFYCPTSPEEGVMIAGRVNPVRFHVGILHTDNPEVAEAIRHANVGAYYEADPATPDLVCNKCGLPIRHQIAFQKHVEEHIRNEVR